MHVHYTSRSRLLHAAASQVVDATLNHQVAGLHLPWTRRLKHDRETMIRVDGFTAFWRMGSLCLGTARLCWAELG